MGTLRELVTFLNDKVLETKIVMTEDRTFSELGVDSIKRIEFVGELRNRYIQKIPDEIYWGWETLNDTLKYIQEKDNSIKIKDLLEILHDGIVGEEIIPTEDFTFYSLGIESMEKTKMILELETDLGYQISEETYFAWQTLGEVQEYINSKTSSKKQYSLTQ